VRPSGPRRPAPGFAPSSRPLSLARALSKFGVCSRAEAARRIPEGRVKVNGRVQLNPAYRLDPRVDRVLVDGTPALDAVSRVVIALHKPRGVVTTRVDPAHRPTVYDLLEGCETWVFPVGRLDRDSSGLLILTNDTRLGHHLTDPEHHVAKTYHVRVLGIPDEEALRALREGVSLGRGEASGPAKVRALGVAVPKAETSAWLELTIQEGKNRQVRRMCAAVGHEVLDLVRVRIGALALGDLAPGVWRRLTKAEIAKLLER
jgi:23S rRNA pseudouridine2605 synthase